VYFAVLVISLHATQTRPMAMYGLLLVQEQVVRTFAVGLQTVHQLPSPLTTITLPATYSKG
jgi:hypothetical protein